MEENIIFLLNKKNRACINKYQMKIEDQYPQKFKDSKHWNKLIK
jgi:hypothetical protein